MWYLDLSWHRSLSWYLSLPCYSSSACYPGLAYLSCSHPYVYFQFMHVMLPLPVFILEVDRTYQSLWLTPFSFASLSSVSPPGSREEMMLFSSGLLCLKVIMYSLMYSLVFSWLWLLHRFILGNNLWKGFMLLYYCKTGFDVFWCKRL